MASYVLLIDFTEKGLQAIGGSPERAEALTAGAREAGVELKSIYWTFGSHDGVVIAEAPNDEAMAAVVLTLAKGGNVRTTTLRAYDASEIKAIVGATG